MDNGSDPSVPAGAAFFETGPISAFDDAALPSRAPCGQQQGAAAALRGRTPTGLASRFRRGDNRALMVFLDAVALTAAALITDALYPSPGHDPDRLLLLGVPGFLLALFLNGQYQRRRVQIGLAEPARAMIRALSSGVLLTLVLAAVFGGSFGRHVQVVKACLVGA
ncbi:MAG: hypothetical protein ACXV3F_05705, partial [Frankiaceae bacterium]